MTSSRTPSSSSTATIVSRTLHNLDGIWVFAYKDGIALRFPDRRSTPDEPRTESGVTSPAAAPSAPAAGEEEPERDGMRRGARYDEGYGVLERAGYDEARDPELSPADRGRSRLDDLQTGARPEPSAWAVRLRVAADDLVDDDNLLGALATASDGFDAHDLAEPAPFGSRYLSVVFPHANWGPEAGDYTTDFRRLVAGPGARAQSWELEVLTSEIGREVTLSWEAPDEILRGALLIDNQTGRRVKPRPGESYTFTPEAARSSFTWLKLH